MFLCHQFCPDLSPAIDAAIVLCGDIFYMYIRPDSGVYKNNGGRVLLLNFIMTINQFVLIIFFLCILFSDL